MQVGEEDDPLVRGEFEVIKELLEKLPGAVEGKRKVDRVIDLCGPGPKGTGLQNLRECIIETKWKYDVAPEDRQVWTIAIDIKTFRVPDDTICLFLRWLSSR